jgi:hypothetical protein
MPAVGCATQDCMLRGTHVIAVLYLYLDIKDCNSAKRRPAIRFLFSFIYESFCYWPFHYFDPIYFGEYTGWLAVELDEERRPLIR